MLLALTYAGTGLAGFDAGSFLGLSTMAWAALAVADAVIHQVYVWLCWRAELHGHHLTRFFGASAFKLYAVLFSILIVLRPILIFGLGWAKPGHPRDWIPGSAMAGRWWRSCPPPT